jgi:hypothetical protein
VIGSFRGLSGILRSARMLHHRLDKTDRGCVVRVQSNPAASTGSVQSTRTAFLTSTHVNAQNNPSPTHAHANRLSPSLVFDRHSNLTRV